MVPICEQQINWADLAQKKVPAPFKPRIKSDVDTSNFSEEFTNMPPACSPGIAPINAEKMFRGYSFMAPSVLFGDNCYSGPSTRFTNSQPTDSNILLAQLRKVSVSYCVYD